MNRCLNDIFGYCTGTPNYERVTTKVHVVGPADGGNYDFVSTDGCKKDIDTCAYHLTHLEKCALAKV